MKKNPTTNSSVWQVQGHVCNTQRPQAIQLSRSITVFTIVSFSIQTASMLGIFQCEDCDHTGPAFITANQLMFSRLKF